MSSDCTQSWGNDPESFGKAFFTKNSRLLRKYKISMRHYGERFDKQKRRCAICDAGPFNLVSGTPLQVDHCHQSGAIRGLPCINCNVMLGMAKDNPSVLRNAANYLEQYRPSKCATT